MKKPYHTSLTEEQKIDRRIKGIGRALSPTYMPSQRFPHNTIEVFNARSKQALDRINARYGRKGYKKIVEVVTGNLEKKNGEF